ncbi:MAG: hypothetical protein LC777_02025 [Actinobacteria bacterium]|nr:hypothetical protein [Actinomycetota bacterium]
MDDTRSSASALSSHLFAAQQACPSIAPRTPPSKSTWVTSVTDTESSAQAAIYALRVRNDGLGDEFLFGASQLRVVVLAIDADEHVRELVAE